MISHAVFGKVHHIDEDMAVYRAHVGGRFSGMPLLDAWIFNIDGLRRYNAWLGYRYMKTFSESISGYCKHVLKSHGKEGAASLNSRQLIKILAIWACYRSIFHMLGLPGRVLGLRKRFAGITVRRTRLSELPPLEASFRWDLIWGLNVKTVEGQRVVPNHPVLRLRAVNTNDQAAQHRHAISECISGLTPDSAYRAYIWVKAKDKSNMQLQFRDSNRAGTGTPGFEGEARYNITSCSVMMTNGAFSTGVEPVADDWRKVWVDLTSWDGKIFVYIGLLGNVDNSHVFKVDGEQLLFGGIEISRRPPCPT
jgi:hypothetical protein